MDIQTKYNLDQKVYSIRKEDTKVWERCTFCEGKDEPIDRYTFDRTEITGRDGDTRICPVCNGHGGEWRYAGRTWVVGIVLTIGQIEVRIHKLEFQEKEREEKYMCTETGIGGGQMWPVDNLFPTEEDALAECALRNSKAEESDK